MRDNNPISIRVFECTTVLVPIWIERRHHAEAGALHPVYRLLPFADFRDVEHQEIFFCRRSTDGMAVRFGKFKMVRRTLPPKHEAVKAVVVLRPGTDPSPELTRELQQLVKDAKGSQQSPKS